MSDLVNKLIVASGQTYQQQAQTDMVKFDFHNVSPFEVDVIWGREASNPKSIYIPPMCSALGYGPDPKLITSDRWNGWMILSVQFPGGGSPPAGAPAQQVTIVGYRAGEAIATPQLVSLQGLTNIGNNVPLSASATSITNDGNVSGTEFIESTPSGGTKAISVKNDGTVSSNPLSNGAQAPALQVVPGGGAGVYAKVQMDNNLIHSNGKGGMFFANGVAEVNEIGQMLAAFFQAFDNTTSADVQVYSAVDQKAGGKTWAQVLKQDGSYYFENITDSKIPLTLNSVGVSFLTGGKLKAISQFSGTGTTLGAAHGLGVTPTAVLIGNTSITGTDNFRWNNPTSTTVDITEGSMSAQSWVAIAFAF